MRAKLRVILPLLLALYIILDTVLKAKNIELCSSTGCEMAGQLLKFNSTYLNYLGIAGALFLVLLSFIKSKMAETLYVVIAVAMVAFETLLITSQLNLNPEVCKFCLGVYSFLLLILLNANIRVFIYTIPTIASIFVAFSILSIPKNKKLITQNGLYLIASKTCPHCKKTKAFLDKEGIKYSVIPSSDINAFYFAKSLSITKIPIAIEKHGDSTKVFVGDKAVIAHYKKAQDKKDITQQTRETKVENFEPKLNLSGDEGCSYSPIEVTNCESEDNTTGN